MIKKVAILGSGLLGGSVALAVRNHLPNIQLTLWGRREEPLKVAQELGIENTTTNLADIIDSDLIILSTPVGVMGSLVSQIIDLRDDRGEDCIITDVGSVKRLTHETIEPLVKDKNIHYVGSHPMAGSEVAGIEGARENLLSGAACIVTQQGEIEGDVVSQVMEIVVNFWSSLGCKVRRMSAEDHDYAVARISHFPHVLACIGAKVGLEYEDIAELAGGGLRDTTRVASGDVGLWSEILLENRDALQRSLAQSISELAQFQEMLRINDEEGMHAYLTEAKRRRDLL